MDTPMENVHKCGPWYCTKNSCPLPAPMAFTLQFFYCRACCFI